MNTIFKILVILVVAVLVGGMFYGAVTATSSGAGQPAGLDRPDGGDLNRHDHGDEAGGFQFPAEAIKNLAIISIIGALYLNVPKLLKAKNPASPIAS